MTQDKFAARKSLAAHLDRCAARAYSVDRTPATKKQCWFLAGLILDAGEDGAEYVTDTSIVLTSREASFQIDNLLRK
jgi:hypothetical protein